MKNKYNPPRDKFNDHCTHPGCTEPRTKCKCILDDGKPCNCYGHKDYYKHGDEKIIPVIEHAHFLPDIDIGRNVNHRAGDPVECPASLKVYTWRTIRGKDRWKKIPVTVRKALGWDD